MEKRQRDIFRDIRFIEIRPNIKGEGGREDCRKMRQIWKSRKKGEIIKNES